MLGGMLNVSRHTTRGVLRSSSRARGTSSIQSGCICLPTEYVQDDENDMLDMAFGLTDTSRLGCQVKLTKELDGMTCTLPSATRNMFVDGTSSVIS